MCFITYLSSFLLLVGWHNILLGTDYQLRLMMWGQTNGTKKKTGNAYIFLYGNPKERDHLLGLDM